jgi:hypothetical protein
MLATLTLIAQLAASPATPADLAFLQGSWEGGQGSLRFEERWTEARGGLMLGLARTSKGEGETARAIGFEFLRIEFRADGAVYIAQPGGRPPTAFRLTEKGSGMALFENPAHDHPKKIRYRLEADGSLVAELEGGEKSQRFVFRPAPSR